MSIGNSCPPDCRLRLNSLEDRATRIEEDNKTTYKHWEDVMASKISNKLFFWLIGVMVTVLVGLFTAVYLQGSTTMTLLRSTRETLIEIKADQDHNKDSLETLDKKLDAHRRERGSKSSGGP